MIGYGYSFWIMGYGYGENNPSSMAKWLDTVNPMVADTVDTVN
jgi:hypothetical protein